MQKMNLFTLLVRFTIKMNLILQVLENIKSFIDLDLHLTPIFEIGSKVDFCLELFYFQLIFVNLPKAKKL